MKRNQPRPRKLKLKLKLKLKSKSKSKSKQGSAKKPSRNWLELPLDITANILRRLGAIDIIENVQKVCTDWREICKDPAMWRVINMHNLGDLHDMPYDLVKMCMHAVDRSQGQLIDINIEYFGTVELIQYVVNRSSQLRRLQLVCCYGSVYEGLSEALKKLPLLEELNLYFTDISKEAIEVAGRCCPLLKSFKLNGQGFKLRDIDSDEEARVEYNENAIAIGENLSELRHLQLVGNRMSNIGLRAILDGCPHLESLDLRRCLNICLDVDLGKICSERIKYLRLPGDSTADYGFAADQADDIYGNYSPDYGFSSDEADDFYGNYYPDYGFAADQADDIYGNYYPDYGFAADQADDIYGIYGNYYLDHEFAAVQGDYIYDIFGNYYHDYGDGLF